MTDLVRMNIVGCGRAAGSLARLWKEASVVAIESVANQSLESSQQAVQRIDQGTAVSGLEAMNPAHLWLLGTPDNAIQATAERLAASGLLRSGDCVFHLAGRHGLDVLAAAGQAGVEIAALHPVRSLTHDHLTVADFRGTACVCEASTSARAHIQPLVEGIGGDWLPVDSIQRGLYHAAVSIISNVTKGVAWKTQNWLVTAGLPEDMATTISHDLLQTTVEDLFRSGARHSITGPVVRGDTSTIEAHLGALVDEHPEDLEVYRVLARTVLELAQDRGDLDIETMKRFRMLLGR